MARTQQVQVGFKGGLVTEFARSTLPYGVLSSCYNFECTDSGYQRCNGFERFDGQASPSSIDLVDGDDTAREAQRALIQAVPGSGDVLGVVYYNGSVYAFRNAADGLSAKMYQSSASGWVEVTTGVTLEPDGRYEFVIYNFYGSAGTAKLYGCDGVNPAFEFDGTTFTQIDTGMESATPALYPSHIAAHQYHLFLSYQGSVMHSVTGNPLDYNAVNGAGEIGVGDTINQMATVQNGVLAILMQNRISMLYGTSTLDWKSEEVKAQNDKVGGKAQSLISIAGRMVYLDDRGLTDLQTTANFGNFLNATISRQIDSFLRSKLPYYRASYSVKTKNQYCMIFDASNDTSEIIVASFLSDDSVAFGRLLLPIQVTSVFSGENSQGEEVIYAGASNGFVYQLEVGTSFDGSEITAGVGTSFLQIGTITQRKRFKRSTLVIDARGAIDFRVKPEFSYGSTEVAGHRIDEVFADGGGGIWGDDAWGDFTWSGSIVNFGHIETEGTGTSMALAIYYAGKYDEAFTLNNLTVDFIPRRLER